MMHRPTVMPSVTMGAHASIYPCTALQLQHPGYVTSVGLLNCACLHRVSHEQLLAAAELKL